MAVTRAIVVVGAGPAGLSAAAAAARLGVHAVVIDERPEPGGHLRDHPHPVTHARAGAEIVAALLEDLPADRITIRHQTVAWGLFEGWRVAVTTGGQTESVDTPAVVLATGLIQRIVPFPGWTSAGVMTAFAARGLLRRHVIPGRRAAVLGKTDLGAWIARELHEAGVEVFGPLEHPTAREEEPEAAPRIRVEGAPRIRRLILTGRDAATNTALDVDLVVLAQGVNPLVELALQAGCRIIFDERLGAHVPACAPDMATSLPGIFAAGGIVGAQDAEEAGVQGRLAGEAAAAVAAQGAPA